jgi:hypothetical protein
MGANEDDARLPLRPPGPLAALLAPYTQPSMFVDHALPAGLGPQQIANDILR